MLFGILGSVQVVAGRQRMALTRSQRRGVLGYLILNVGTEVSTSDLTVAMWGDAPPATAREQIHSAIHEIRRQFTALGAPDLLVSTTSGYSLYVPQAGVDLYRFADLTGQARAARERHDDADAARLLTRAMQTWRGTPLSDASGTYVAQTRARLDDQRLIAEEDLIELEVAAGRASTVLDRLFTRSRQEPARERVHTLLMLALHQLGRTVEAMDVARRYQSHLAEHYGLDAGCDFTKLQRSMLRGGSAGLVGPASPAGLGPASPAGLVGPASPAGLVGPASPAGLVGPASPAGLARLMPTESESLLRRFLDESPVSPEVITELAEACDHLPGALHLAGTTLAGCRDDEIARYIQGVHLGRRFASAASEGTNS